MATSSMNIRMDSGIKKQAQELFAALGLDMSTAVNIFLRQAIQRQGLPFEVVLREPNAETLEAKEEVEAMKRAPDNHRSYKNSNAMMKELLA
ncbi:MAG: type II toxin-antitoxin system RelB/DinJ family antitoxin [Desulfovibrio sp.]|nr:type II toxin-antitoxin system RelB/DinJ family antitoxin [Desulfovibrio sp.]